MQPGSARDSLPGWSLLQSLREQTGRSPSGKLLQARPIAAEQNSSSASRHTSFDKRNVESATNLSTGDTRRGASATGDPHCGRNLTHRVTQLQALDRLLHLQSLQPVQPPVHVPVPPLPQSEPMSRQLLHAVRQLAGQFPAVATASGTDKALIARQMTPIQTNSNGREPFQRCMTHLLWQAKCGICYYS